MSQMHARVVRHDENRQVVPARLETRASRDVAANGAARPWQLEMFDFSLKKSQKFDMLRELVGVLTEERCLLVTNGDNPGGLNYHLRALGGHWSWVELEEEGIPQIEELLKEPVLAGTAQSLPFADAQFDRVVVVDVHEHLDEVDPLNREIARILAPEGVAIVTTPTGNPRLPVAVLKRLIGMDNASYGHKVQGYRVHQLEAMLAAAGLEPLCRGAYSRFFTELAELGINFLYVKVLGRRKSRKREAGVIAPRNADQLKSVGGAYRLYRMVFPLIRAFSALDALVPGQGGYAVAVAARRVA